MATDNTVGGLYMRLGLSLDELETDFIAAERTTRENLNRLNRESNLIRLRAEVEIGNLDETADAMQILTVRENALNQQMAIQRDRIRLADAAMQDLIQRHGKFYINEECGECIVKPESVAQFVYRNIFMKEFYEGDTFTDGGLIRRAELRADFPVYDRK